jgi:uncharacterized protein (TIGR03435 family)
MWQMKVAALAALTTMWFSLATPMVASAQTAVAPSFAYDVVSVKPNKSGDDSMRIGWGGDSYIATNAALSVVLMAAYGLKTEEQVSGLPGWAKSSKFDLQAKMDDDTVARMKTLSKDDANLARRTMLQALLADRFGLKAHLATRDLPKYELVVAKGGLKLKEADPNDAYSNGMKGPNGSGGAGMFMMGWGEITTQGVPLGTFANALSSLLGRQVDDKTGLSGKYDLHLKWTPEDEDAPSGTGTGPSIFAALQEQAGLELKSVKGPVDTIVVDSIAQPTEN